MLSSKVPKEMINLNTKTGHTSFSGRKRECEFKPQRIYFGEQKTNRAGLGKCFSFFAIRLQYLPVTKQKL